MFFDSVRGHERDLGAAGVSVQGAVHRFRKTPCQDAFMVRHMSRLTTWRDGGNRDRLVVNEHYVVAAVADGLGSAAHSDVGAHIAVNVAVSSACEAIGVAGFGNDATRGDAMRGIVEGAFVDAHNAMLKKAESMGVDPGQLDSTLVLAIYNGEELYFGSAGDSGLIAQTSDGYRLVSHPARVGESGTYPLYCRDHWELGEVTGVSGFLLATDGMLDLFVPGFCGDGLNEDAVRAFLLDIPCDAERSCGAMERDLERTVEELVERGFTYDDATVLVAVDWDRVRDDAAALDMEPAGSEEPVGAVEPNEAAAFGGADGADDALNPDATVVLKLDVPRPDLNGENAGTYAGDPALAETLKAQTGLEYDALAEVLASAYRACVVAAERPSAGEPPVCASAQAESTDR